LPPTIEGLRELSCGSIRRRDRKPVPVPDARQSLVVHHAARPALVQAGLKSDRVIYLEAGDDKSVLARFEEGFAPQRARRRRRGSRPPADDRFAAASSRG
jgi:hypothetical protein